jgi:hypothetical protein
MVHITKAAGRTHIEPLAIEEGRHHDTLTTTRAPLLPSQADIDAIVDRAQRIALKRVFRQMMVGLVFLVLELVVLTLAGLASRELRRVKTVRDEPYGAV